MAVFNRDRMHMRIGYLNGAQIALEWEKKQGIKESEHNGLDNPDTEHAITLAAHDAHGLDWSYGGWMEDRTLLWRDTYLKGTGKFLHLGIDLSVPADVLVFALADGEIVHVDTDSPLKGGWGGHVVQIINHHGERHALIYAHLGDIHVRPRTLHAKRSLIGKIGDKSQNGYWAPHLHLQLVSDIDHVTDWKKFLDSEMDGYGEISKRDYWAKRCLDPTPLIW